jgi:hypothetical protein
VVAFAAAAPSYAAKPSDKLLTPKIYRLILIDRQPQRMPLPAHAGVPGRRLHRVERVGASNSSSPM